MKVLSLDRLPYFVQKIKELLPRAVSKEAAGLVPALPQELGEERVLLGTGEWGEYHGGGGGAGLVAFEVHDDGHLYMIYDNGMGEPSVELKKDGPLTGHLVWTYESEE